MTDLEMLSPEDKKTAENEKKKKKETDFYENFIVAYTIILTITFPIVATYTYFYGTVPAIKILFYVACSGALGGLVYSMLGFVKHHEDKSFDSMRFFWWYIYRPITAMILGVFSFFFIAGGLMTLSGLQEDVLPSGPFEIKAVMFYCALAFLVGYANNPFLRKIYDLANVFFGETSGTPGQDDKGTKPEDSQPPKGKTPDGSKETL